MSLFNFNFYSGEVLGQNSSGIITFIEPIIATALGFLLAKGYDWLGGRKKINRAGEDLINEIHLLRNPIDKQVFSINEAIKILKQEKTVSPPLNFIFSLNTERVNFINRTDVVEFFDKYYSGNRFLAREKVNNIYAALEVITNNSKMLETLYNAFFERAEVETDKYKENNGLILRRLTHLAGEIARRDILPDSDPFYNKIHTLWKDNFGTSEPIDLFVKNKTFNIPLSEFLSNNFTDERVIDFNDFNYKCLDAYNCLDDLKKELILKFEIIITSLNTQFTELLKNIKDIKKK